jgi:hypothetical protein
MVATNKATRLFGLGQPDQAMYQGFFAAGTTSAAQNDKIIGS